MARESRQFTATIPGGTLPAAPLVTDIPIPVGIVRQVRWRVPAGNLGLLGWRITMGGVQVLPSGGDPWVIADGQTGDWQLDGYPDSGAWQVTGYNTGSYAHSVYVTLDFDPVTRAPVYPVPIAATDLMLAPDLSRAGPPVRRRQ